VGQNLGIGAAKIKRLPISRTQDRGVLNAIADLKMVETYKLRRDCDAARSHEQFVAINHRGPTGLDRSAPHQHAGPKVWLSELEANLGRGVGRDMAHAKWELARIDTDARAKTRRKVC